MQHRHLKGPVTLFGLAAALLAAIVAGISLLPDAARADLEFRPASDPAATVDPLDDTPPGFQRSWYFSSLFPGFPLPPDTYGDPTISVTIDPISGRVRENYLEQDVEVREPLITSDRDYGDLVWERNKRRLWNNAFLGNRSVVRTAAARGSIFRLDIPVTLPKAVQSIVGKGAPNLEVTGSETISLSGKSDWTANQSQFTGENRRQGAFPSFEMKQDLNVNLTGSIGDKIKVDVDQSSNVQTSVDNKVKLRYEGDDDDMIKSIELGNTNLSLAGASIRQEGLFGVKSAMKLGNVDLVTIASRQEGKNETSRFTPSGDLTHVIIRDLDYIKGQYFLISDHPMYIDLSKLEVWRDDANNTNNQLPTRPGFARLDPTKAEDDSLNPQLEGHWDPLKPEIDYTVSIDYWRLDNGQKIPVLKLTQPLATSQMLAVSYQEITPTGVIQIGTPLSAIGSSDPTIGKSPDSLVVKMLRPSYDNLRTDAVGNFDPAGPWYKVLPYELRNFYYLQAANINESSMILTIRRLSGNEATPPDHLENNPDPLIKILGLDQLNATGEAGTDGRVDDRYVDSEKGILWFPDINPFDPNDPAAPYHDASCAPDSVGFNCLNDKLRNVLQVSNDQNLSTANPIVYYRKTPGQDDARYVIDAQIQSSRNGYFLGRFGILEGSETVRVNNVVWTRGTDYDIDYATGQLTFRRTPNPNDPVTVDYSFAQGAGQVSQTLAGVSASYSPSADQTVTSSFLYESKGATEDLVKLGEEPATSMIGDLSTVLAFRPVWMTQLVNGIPGIRTSAPSNLNLQGSISTNIPNPNTKGEAYIDDMEGNRESNTLSLTRPQWFWSSVPSTKVASLANHAGIEWYNPANAVKEHDLRPVLSQAEGGENIHQVLEMSFLNPQADSTNTMLLDDWNGVTQSLGTVGQDLTKTLYMEIWVNDFHNSSYSTPLQHSQTRAVLHMDFGRVDEDAFWDPKNLPNGQLDTEDKNGNGVLDRPLDDQGKPLNPGTIGGYEDTGLDGKIDADETGYNPDSNKDPDGDDYAYDVNKNANDYSKINNTEGNGIDAQSRPDTEDLNRNGVLDRENAYFEASIDLSRDQFVAIDVPQLYGNLDVVKNNANNGWRLFRIPVTLTDSTFQRIGAASWDNIQAVRFWVDGMDTPQKFQIGGIELVGNRWLRQAYRDSASYATRGVTLEVGSRNNKDDAGIYQAPYSVKDAVGSTATRREQSLSLAYKNLSPGDSVFAFKTYGDAGNGGFGWAEYQTLKFYVHGDKGVNVEAESLRAIARFGPDTLNYYEYSVPVRSDWQAISIPMERLSGLKAKLHGDTIYVDSTTAAATQEVYTVRGNPSFTRISRVSFGLTVHGTPAFSTPGEVWIDELRLGNVRKDHGVSSSVTLQANFADLMTLNASIDQTDKDYFRVGSGATQGSGFDHTNLSLSSTFNLDRFLPTSGVVLPINVSAQHTTDVPKFRTGSDVILDAARSKVETRQFDRQSIGVSYHRSSPKKGLSRYTLDAISGDMSYSKQGEISPQASDSSWLFTMGGTYSIPIGFSGLKLGPMRVNPLPRTFQVQTNWRSSRDVLFSRTLSDTADVFDNRSDVKQRLLSMRLDSRFEPLPSVSVTYALGSARDMLLHQQNGPFGWNKGTEISHDQTLTLNYRPRWLSLFNPDVTVTGTYREQASSERRDVPGLRNLKDISNQGNVRTNLTLPISRFGGRATRSPRDSIPTVSVLAPIRFFFSKWQDISASFDFQRSAALTRVIGDPGKQFKSGFTEVFDPSIRITPSSTFGSSRRYHGTANTGFKPIDRLTFQIRGDYILSYSDALYGERRNLSWSYPEVNANWSDLQRLLGLNGSISSLTLTSTYTRQRDEAGPVGGIFEQRSTQTRFSPLLGWNATFRNGIRVNAQSNYETQDTQDGRAGPGYLQSRTQKGTSIEVNKNFPAARGIKLPWKKERVKLPNDLNLGARLDLSSSLLVRHQPTNDLVDSDTQSFRISSQNSYNFSAAMVGGFNLEYRQDVNKQLGTAGTRRGITIELNGTFRF
ncbi:MAG: cell surface protein SprA [Bacteroidota bacterium]